MSHGNAFNDSENLKLFRIKLELCGNRLRFMPSLSTDEHDKDSFLYTIQCLIKDICSVSHQINRIAQPSTSECVAAKRTYQSKLKCTFSDVISKLIQTLFRFDLLFSTTNSARMIIHFASNIWHISFCYC